MLSQRVFSQPPQEPSFCGAVTALKYASQHRRKQSMMQRPGAGRRNCGRLVRRKRPARQAPQRLTCAQRRPACYRLPPWWLMTASERSERSDFLKFSTQLILIVAAPACS